MSPEEFAQHPVHSEITRILWLLNPQVAADHREEAIATLMKEQRGKCAICRKKRATDIDHDHKTLLVRGVLCRGCNLREGRKDHNAADYRANPPARARWVFFVREHRFGSMFFPQGVESLERTLEILKGLAA